MLYHFVRSLCHNRERTKWRTGGMHVAQNPPVLSPKDKRLEHNEARTVLNLVCLQQSYHFVVPLSSELVQRVRLLDGG